MNVQMMPNAFDYASRHGDMIPCYGLSYVEDDNTYERYTFYRPAAACYLADAPKKRVEVDDLYAAMFN